MKTLSWANFAMGAIAVAIPATAEAQTYRSDSYHIGSVYQVRRYAGAVYDPSVNKTFVVHNGSRMNVWVFPYNHTTKAWEPAIKAATIDRGDANAYHDYALIHLLPNGKLAVFWNTHTSSAQMAIAPTAHSAAGTWTTKKISSDRNTYPTSIIVGNTVYMFYSHNTDLGWPYRRFNMIKSTDNGATWSAPRTLVDSGKTADRFSEVYAYGLYSYSNRIYFTYTMCGGTSGHNKQCSNVYMNYLNTTDNAVYTAKGGPLGNVVDEADLPKSLVISAPSGGATAPDSHTIRNPFPAVDGSGNPLIAFGYNVGTTKTVKFGRLTNGNWTFENIATDGNTFNHMIRSGDGVDILYSNGGRVTSVHRAASGAITKQFTLDVDKRGTDADSWAVNYTQGGGPLIASGVTYNGVNRQKDYSGKWPLFAIFKQ